MPKVLTIDSKTWFLILASSFYGSLEKIFNTCLWPKRNTEYIFRIRVKLFLSVAKVRWVCLLVKVFTLNVPGWKLFRPFKLTQLCLYMYCATAYSATEIFVNVVELRSKSKANWIDKHRIKINEAYFFFAVWACDIRRLFNYRSHSVFEDSTNFNQP